EKTLPATTGRELIDRKGDLDLNKAIRAQFLNEPPPVGFFLAKSHGRIYILRLVGARQDIAYTGYERILDGRPEESVPPSNRLRLAIGADEIRGGGALQAGLVAFSKSNEMFMLRGNPEDVTSDEPILFTAFLEQLPWDLGCASGYTVRSTPHGIAWLGSDLKVYLFNGFDEPLDMSEGIYPLLKEITPNQKQNARAAFFRWVESDWYALLVPVNGATKPNRIFLFDLTNDDKNVGVGAILDIQADSIAVIENSTGDRKLVIGQQGRIKQLVVESQTVSGIHEVISSTAGQLPARWQSGYFGGESPQRMKMFRFARLVVDQGGFGILARVVDDKGKTLRDPEFVQLSLEGDKATVNRKGRRISFELQFPNADVSSAVLELSSSYIPLG
ncbi:hypothetical protein LCGC14_2894790, partial [marine sediment metagenome]